MKEVMTTWGQIAFAIAGSLVLIHAFRDALREWHEHISEATEKWKSEKRKWKKAVIATLTIGACLVGFGPALFYLTETVPFLILNSAQGIPTELSHALVA